MIDDRGFSEHALLDHYERAHCSRQWSAFIGVLMDELFRSAGEHEARSFLRHIGRRLAQAFELGRHDTLQSLEAAMNGYWGALDWGYVELAERDTGIVIRHSAYPVPARLADAALARASMAAVLEGVYAAWLEKQSGDGGIPLRGTAAAPGRVLELYYGRR